MNNQLETNKSLGGGNPEHFRLYGEVIYCGRILDLKPTNLKIKIKTDINYSLIQQNTHVFVFVRRLLSTF